MNFTWFRNSPNVNDPDCLCSVCLKPITADEENEEDPNLVILRIFNIKNDTEARFHQECEPEDLTRRLSKGKGKWNP